jgi:hypothetical protein
MIIRLGPMPSLIAEGEKITIQQTTQARKP